MQGRLETTVTTCLLLGRRKVGYVLRGDDNGLHAPVIRVLEECSSCRSMLAVWQKEEAQAEWHQ